MNKKKGDEKLGDKKMHTSNSEYLVRNPVQAALQSNKRQKANIF